MIIFSAVKLKGLFEKERDYLWTRSEGCPCCNSYRLWRHGFAEAIFDGYDRPLLLKLEMVVLERTTVIYHNLLPYGWDFFMKNRLT